jgi:hypothetical protein
MSTPTPSPQNVLRASALAPLLGLVTLAAQAQPCIWQHRETVAPTAQQDAQFGWFLAGVGDVTSNGSGDLAIGAHFYDHGPLISTGAVFLYAGGQPVGTPPFRSLYGQTGDEHFGTSIAGGFDIDGDQIHDLAIGARLRFSGTGAVDVFRGSAAFATTPWLTLVGEANNDWFGQSVALGDLDGDGYAEIIVGAPYSSRGGNGSGAVFIYRGGPTPSTQPWLILSGEGNHNHFGWSVAFLGDFTGNGYGDIAVGARLHGTGLNAARGKAYVFQGGPSMSATPVRTWLGAARDDWFGQSVAAVGDVNGGGRPDLLVGAPYNDQGALNAGAAYLFYGEHPAGSPPAAVYLGQSADAQFGWAVGGAGDVDGDGRPDLLVGARMQSAPGLPAAGRMYLFSGANTSTAPFATVNGAAANDWLGNSVGSAIGFKVLGRGTPVAGIPYADVTASNQGAAGMYDPCTAAPCYANCDQSTTPPILNVEDFSCFINQFASAQGLAHELQLTHYANCDQSTTPPVLNVEDFSCFINRFSQGCR